MTKKQLRSTTAATTVAALVATSATQAQTNDTLVDKLQKKGILTEQEAKELKAGAPKPASSSDLRWFWKDGLNIQSGDGKFFKGKLSGRVQTDVAAFFEDDELERALGPLDAGVEFRRVRLSTEGEFATGLPSFYKVEFDFVGGAEFKDVFAGVTGLPVVNTLQIGNFKEPIGLDMLTSSRFLPFMERALPIEAFAPERNLGAMFYRPVLEERMTWALGAFTSYGDLGEQESVESDYRISGRVTALPWYDEEAKGSRLFHMGLSGSYIKPEGDALRFRSRPESHMAPRFVDTGTLAADNGYLGGAEAALVVGPFSLQAEYLRQWVDQPAGNLSFDGFYVLGSYFLTGENREYRRSTGVFDRLHPKHNVSLKDGGLGAWEVLVRFSQLDLDDDPVDGGDLRDITGGLNWYLNPNTKVQFNYVYAHTDRRGSDGEAHIVQSRLHIDF